jgi:crotonobetainyl-CoA:carnitine CoA-transferase CaiB-like acyl-CoA transferase
MAQQDFFKGLKVVELAGVLAGPAVGMFFAELGAEVIKIENPESGGDMTRHWKLPTEKKSRRTSAYFSAVNYRKTYLFLSFKRKEDRKKIIDLVKEADIVLTNFKAGSAAKYGLDYPSLKKVNAQLIYGEISGFISNPDKVAFDLVLQAETGFMYMNGTPNSGPVKMPVALIDILAAHQLKEGILLALLKRNNTGKGSKISVSLEKSALSSLANQASNFLMEAHIPQPMEVYTPTLPPMEK